MSRTQSLALMLALALVPACQQQEQTGQTEEPLTADTTAMEEGEAEPDLSTPEGKIANAESAGPEEIAADAAIMDWPATEGGETTELRAGTNGWTCMTDVPNTPGNDPMCLDAQWMKWAAAWQARETPQIDGVGLAYMLAGGTDASNTDPYATEPAPGEDWIDVGPHVMMLTPDAAQLETLPTDPQSGGPWVMWKGTPYAHIMMPIESAD
jgi:hypothetical protein